MAWYWQVIIAVIILNIDLVLAVLLGSEILGSLKGNTLTTEAQQREAERLRAQARAGFVIV